MKVLAHIKNFSSISDKLKIQRNLAKIMNVRILDSDMHTKVLTIICGNELALEQAIQELRRIGLPATFEVLNGQKRSRKMQPITVK
ncbi:hypothetical protein PP178_10210 [Zeaxanthinibacter sp. PT1]|uniref:hypothetical protein n=1 Tax=Zeaxanthinibacter TaxID=561554 RepID=UPI00234A487E|nr:hypothetical protein [Zeaxanthinibacter sp. PT1]MDC6351927.1 hypothetical protein [Zeaxanthinibacter sp. PT1]